MPNSAITPSIATKPNGAPNRISVSTTPIRPSGAVSTTSSVRWKLPSWIISSVSTTTSISGVTLAIAPCEFWLASSEPPSSMW
ncbi:hypothetical protein D3C85_1803660 [compost metagenome]